MLYKRLEVSDGDTEARYTGPFTDKVSVGLDVPIPTLPPSGSTTKSEVPIVSPPAKVDVAVVEVATKYGDSTNEYDVSFPVVVAAPENIAVTPVNPPETVRDEAEIEVFVILPPVIVGFVQVPSVMVGVNISVLRSLSILFVCDTVL